LAYLTSHAIPDLSSLSLHDALQIWSFAWPGAGQGPMRGACSKMLRCPAVLSNISWRNPARHIFVIMSVSPARTGKYRTVCGPCRSEELTSELQSRENLVCRLLLEKK